jgi:hypothetical protein
MDKPSNQYRSVTTDTGLFTWVVLELWIESEAGTGFWEPVAAQLLHPKG